MRGGGGRCMMQQADHSDTRSDSSLVAQLSTITRAFKATETAAAHQQVSCALLLPLLHYLYVYAPATQGEEGPSAAPIMIAPLGIFAL